MMNGKVEIRSEEVRYQPVCSWQEGEDGRYIAFGLQCLEGIEGAWKQVDVIEDVSVHAERVLSMADRFNALYLSPIHFRDVVMDRLGG